MQGVCCGVLLMTASAAFAGPSENCDTPVRVIRHAERAQDDDDRFLQQVLDRVGCRLQVQIASHRVPLDRRMQMLRDGSIDLLVGVSRLPERERFGIYSVPYRRERTRLWIRKDDREKAGSQGFEQLVNAGWKVIGPNRDWFGARYQRLRERTGGIVADYSQLGQGVKLLMGHRGDLLVGDELLMTELPETERASVWLLAELQRRIY